MCNVHPTGLHCPVFPGTMQSMLSSAQEQLTDILTLGRACILPDFGLRPPISQMFLSQVTPSVIILGPSGGCHCGNSGPCCVCIRNTHLSTAFHLHHSVPLVPSTSDQWYFAWGRILTLNIYIAPALDTGCDGRPSHRVAALYLLP